MAGAPAACASQREPRTGKESSSRSSQQEEAAEREYGHQQCEKKTVLIDYMVVLKVVHNIVQPVHIKKDS